MHILMISYWGFQDCGMQVTQATPYYFAEQGHKVTFLCHHEMTLNPGDHTSRHENLRIRVFDLPYKFINKIPKVRRVRQLLLFRHQVLSELKEMKRRGDVPDVVYAAESDSIFAGKAVARILNCPFVTRYYGISTALLQHKVAHYTYWRSLKVPADLCILTDDGTMSPEELKRINPNISELLFLRNGIEQPHVCDSEVDRIRDRYGLVGSFVCLTVSRLYGWKRLDRAVKSVCEARRIGTDVKLLIVGHGPEEESLKELINSMDLQDSVFIVGAVSHKDIYNWYFCSDVLLSCFDMSNVGNALWESKNCGIPIITLDNGLTGTHVNNGCDGYLVDSSLEDGEMIPKLAEKIRTLSCDKELYRNVCEQVRSRAKTQLLSWDERLDIELKEIEGLLIQ